MAHAYSAFHYCAVVVPARLRKPKGEAVEGAVMVLDMRNPAATRDRLFRLAQFAIQGSEVVKLAGESMRKTHPRKAPASNMTGDQLDCKTHVRPAKNIWRPLAWNAGLTRWE